ncbi:MAG: D-glycerate dehydrogenase [Trueperaceae bacterium]|nr:D-glycerate dehydrogenase [Trueperaceae bacterium]
MTNILITRRVPQVGVRLLKEAGFEPDIIETDLPIARDELLKRVSAKSYQAILTTMSEKVDDEFLDVAGKDLKIVANFAVGYNNIDVEACKSRGVRVSNTPGVLSEATADQAFALLLAAARRVVEGHKLVESGTWEGWTPTQLLGRDLSGQTLGIIGMGRIGQEMAKRSRGFDMRLIYHNRSRDEEAEKNLGAVYKSLDELLAESDFISVHTPLNAETEHLLCYEQFKKMKKTAIIINTARGPIIHEKALVKALQEKWIWAAGLDVFEFEPKVTEELLTMPNVVLAPHLGSATEGTRDAMISLAATAIIKVLKGETPSNLVA